MDRFHGTGGLRELCKKKALTHLLTVAPREDDDWPGWRGSKRDARVAWLPDTLPATPGFVWTAELSGEGVAGLSVAGGFVVVAGRDLADRQDVFQCFRADTGKLVWQHRYPAPGELDYGNAPRATPLIHEDLVITLGAFGHLCCLELETGIVLWNRNIAADFGAAELTWGHTASPLIVGGNLIVQPGGPDASVVALDPDTGKNVWVAPGLPASYSSFINMKTAAGEQILGLDATSLGGWDAKNGQRLWRLVPPVSGDFNVPTPVLVGGRVLAVSENNGARLYEIGPDGLLQPQPLLQNPDLKPDSHTPVVSGGRIYGICNDLLELDPSDQLKTRSTLSDDAFTDYCSLIASDSRLLVLSSGAELVLVSTDGAAPQILSRLKLSSERIQTLSHPAVVSGSLYVRLNRTLARMDLR